MAVSEDEEFEFRRRAEAEAAAPAPPAVQSRPIQDAVAGFVAPFQTLGHDVMENYRQHQSASIPTSLGDAASRTVKDVAGTGKMLADVLGLGAAPVSAVTHPMANALAKYGPTPYSATPQGPVALQGADASNAIEGSLNTALAGARPAGFAMADALAAHAPTPAPSIAELRGQSSALYDKAKATGFEVKAPVYQDFAGKLQARLDAEGIDEDLQPKAAAALRRIQGAANGNMDLTILDNLRKISTNATAAAAGNPADKRLTRMITDAIDAFVGDLKAADVHSGDPEAASAMLGEARGLWKKQAKGQVIEDLIAKAKNNPAGNLNLDSALRSQFQKLMNNKRGMAQFTPDEQVAIMKVASGSPFDQTMFNLGKMAPTNLHTMGAESLMGAAGFTAGHPALGAAPAAIGIPAKVISTMNTSRNAKLASALMRRGGK